MLYLYYVYLIVLGLIFGSFGSVLISRFYSKESGIYTGRSHCTSCGHTLSALDLFPLFSYLFLGGKCRYCKKKISPIYPTLEVVMAIFFFMSGYMLVDPALILQGNGIEIIRLLSFLFISFVIVVISFYDILYQLIPTELLGPAIIIYFVLLVLEYFFPNLLIFFGHFYSFKNPSLNIPILNALLGALVVYSFFYIQIFLPGAYYAIEKKKPKIILEQIYEFFAIPFWILISPFVKEKQNDEETKDDGEEVYTFMGHGDLWIAIFMGFVAGFKMAVMGLALAYLIGSIVGVYIIATRRKRNIAIAFGPFLGLGLFISLLYYQPILNAYFSLLGLK